MRCHFHFTTSALSSLGSGLKFAHLKVIFFQFSLFLYTFDVKSYHKFIIFSIKFDIRFYREYVIIHIFFLNYVGGTWSSIEEGLLSYAFLPCIKSERYPMNQFEILNAQFTPFLSLCPHVKLGPGNVNQPKFNTY